MFLGLCQALSKCFHVSSLPVTMHGNRKNDVSDSQDCCNKLKQTCWPKTTGTYYLMFLKAQRSKLKVSARLSSLSAHGRLTTSYIFSQMQGCCLAYGCLTPGPASVFTCVSALVFVSLFGCLLNGLLPLDLRPIR